MDSLEISAVIPASPATIYDAWLSSKGHTAMTGGVAKVSSRAAGRFNAWDGYISGTNLELEKDKRIVQSWRTTEFGDTDPDSRLEIVLTGTGEGTKVTLRHDNIPDGRGDDYRQGWKEFYLEPMAAYFKAGG